jgi:hypothetical protein
MREKGEILAKIMPILWRVFSKIAFALAHVFVVPDGTELLRLHRLVTLSAIR